jgi:hypothetical protein
MSEIVDTLTAIRASSALLERAILTAATSDDIDSCDRADILYHLRRNRLHVDLTAGRLHQIVLSGGDAE